MFLIGTEVLQAENMCFKYSNKFNYIKFNRDNFSNNDYILNYIETVKSSLLQMDVTFVAYDDWLIKIFNELHFNYTVIKRKDEVLSGINDTCTLLVLQKDSYELTLKPMFSWINVEESLVSVIPEDKNKLTFEQLLNEDVSITESDVRALKETQNKLKVGMLLQAKNSLNRILKLTTVLDKLYDELVNRIDLDLTTTDTASIMYTADYISKALQDTNKLIVDLISNDKIQNFFIIDNSQNINIQGELGEPDSRSEINSREKIRKAAEIVLKNLDLFQQGDLTQLKNPNEVFEQHESIKEVLQDNVIEGNVIEEGVINDS